MSLLATLMRLLGRRPDVEMAQQEAEEVAGIQRRHEAALAKANTELTRHRNVLTADSANQAQRAVHASGRR